MLATSHSWLPYRMTSVEAVLVLWNPSLTRSAALSLVQRTHHYIFLLSCLLVHSSYLKDLRGGNDFLGKAYVSLKDLPLKGEDSWFELQSHRGRLRGRVQMKLHIDVKMVSRWHLRVGPCVVSADISCKALPPCRRELPTGWLSSTTRNCSRPSVHLRHDGQRPHPLPTWPVWRHR